MMLRTGVIGVGSMGQNHARVYSEISDLVGIADSNKRIAKEIASRFRTKWCTAYKELLKSDVEAVTISTPTVTHYKVAMDAIRAGKHVLIEKPISDKVKNAKKIIDEAEREGVVLAVGHVERHNPIVKFTKERVERGEFGKVISVSARRVSSFPARIRDVGVIHDLGIHDIDVMRYIVESDVEKVYTLAGSSDKGRFEDYADILLKFRNGINGSIQVNWLTPMKVRIISLTCSKSFVTLNYTEQSIKISSSSLGQIDTADLYHLPLEFDVQEISLRKQEPLKNELLDFLNAIEKGKEPLVTGDDGLKALEIADAALKSYKSGREIKMRYCNA